MPKRGRLLGDDLVLDRIEHRILGTAAVDDVGGREDHVPKLGPVRAFDKFSAARYGALMHLPRSTATLIGFSAILLWAFLAVFTAASGTMPPFQLTAITFGIGGLAGVALWTVRPQAARALRQPWPVWLIGVGGLFGYHALYFIALRNAPPVEAGLINYLWPLLIVVFSALLPGERLRWYHIAGALLALAGAALVVTGGQGFALKSEYIPGYLCALGAALVWAAYSVLSRRFRKCRAMRSPASAS
jgi:drug/metabolite transporter (DMT)-like permease